MWNLRWSPEIVRDAASDAGEEFSRPAVSDCLFKNRGGYRSRRPGIGRTFSGSWTGGRSRGGSVKLMNHRSDPVKLIGRQRSWFRDEVFNRCPFSPQYGQFQRTPTAGIRARRRSSSISRSSSKTSSPSSSSPRPAWAAPVSSLVLSRRNASSRSLLWRPGKIGILTFGRWIGIRQGFQSCLIVSRHAPRQVLVDVRLWAARTPQAIRISLRLVRTVAPSHQQ